jgi:hypothetical protein
MIHDIEPFPEYKNKIDSNKTALHVASILGHDKKLRVILNEFTKKYEFGRSNINIKMI